MVTEDCMDQSVVGPDGEKKRQCQWKLVNGKLEQILKEHIVDLHSKGHARNTGREIHI